MMGGLAYMTGLPDRPLRAGSSVVDIMGGTFAAVGVLAALRERETPGAASASPARCSRAPPSSSRQHMAQYELTGEAPPPMSMKRPAWGVYDIFETAGGRTPVRRGRHRHAMGRLLPGLRAGRPARRRAAQEQQRAGAAARLAAAAAAGHLQGLRAGGAGGPAGEDRACPSRPSPRPWDLLDDPHLAASGGLLETKLPSGKRLRVPALPVELDGQRLGKRADPPAVGQHGRELLAGLGVLAGGNRLAARAAHCEFRRSRLRKSKGPAGPFAFRFFFWSLRFNPCPRKRLPLRQQRCRTGRR